MFKKKCACGGTCNGRQKIDIVSTRRLFDIGGGLKVSNPCDMLRKNKSEINSLIKRMREKKGV